MARFRASREHWDDFAHKCPCLVGVVHQNLYDGLYGDIVVVGVPAVEIRNHSDSCVTHLGFAGEFRFGHVRHADYRASPLPVEFRFGPARELRAFHGEIAAASDSRYIHGFCRVCQSIAETRANGFGH